MKYFKDENNQVFAYEADGSQDAFILHDLVAITDEEADLIRNPPETPEQTIARLGAYLDTYIDQQANSFRYESIRTMVTYVGDPNSQFNAEGVGALEFRSRCYTLALTIINEVNQGRPVPTGAELIAEMPLLSDFIVYQA